MSDESVELLHKLIAGTDGVIMQWTSKNSFMVTDLTIQGDNMELHSREYKIEEIK